jgi:signal transduction protein with GAF and PtsI domain
VPRERRAGVAHLYEEANPMKVSAYQLVSPLCDVCNTIVSTYDLPEVLSLIVRTVTVALPVKASTLRLLDAEERRLEIAAVHGLGDAYLSKGPVEVDHSPIDQEALAGKVVAVLDASTDQRFQYPEEARREGIYSVLCVPLKARDRAIGVLRAYTSIPHEFTEEEVKALSTLAAHGALAIENARLRDACSALAATFDLDQLLSTIVKTVTEAMHAKGSMLRLLDSERRELAIAAVYGLSEEYLQKGAVEVEKSPVDQKALAGEVVTILDATADSSFQYADEAKREGICSVLCVPVRTADTTLGVLRAYTAVPHEFTEHEVQLLRTLAHHGAIAIEGARQRDQIKKEYDDLRGSIWQWYEYVQRQGHL